MGDDVGRRIKHLDNIFDKGQTQIHKVITYTNFQKRKAWCCILKTEGSTEVQDFPYLTDGCSLEILPKLYPHFVFQALHQWGQQEIKKGSSAKEQFSLAI